MKTSPGAASTHCGGEGGGGGVGGGEGGEREDSTKFRPSVSKNGASTSVTVLEALTSLLRKAWRRVKRSLQEIFSSEARRKRRH